MLYTATQGEERVFPNYFTLPERSVFTPRELPARAQEVSRRSLSISPEA